MDGDDLQILHGQEQKERRAIEFMMDTDDKELSSIFARIVKIKNSAKPLHAQIGAFAQLGFLHAYLKSVQSAEDAAKEDSENYPG